jgi:hypothetical protein
MSNYDAFVLNQEGEIVQSKRFVAESDMEALALAKQFVVNGQKLELWEGERNVAEVSDI